MQLSTTKLIFRYWEHNKISLHVRDEGREKPINYLAHIIDDKTRVDNAKVFQIVPLVCLGKKEEELVKRTARP